MGDEQRARPRRAQDAGDLLAQRLAQPGVERRERLVEQHDLGIGGEGARERDALALAAGQLVRVVAGAVGEADELEALGHALAPLGAEADVAGHRQVREQRAVLEDHADPPVLGLDPHAVAGHGAARDRHAARVGLLEAGDHAQQRGLARAARPEQGHQLARGHAQAGAGDRPSAAERLLDALRVDREIGLRHQWIRLP